MSEKRLCLAGEDSLRMLRFARRNEDLILVPAEKDVLRGCDDAVDAQTLASSLPPEIFAPSRQRPVCLRFDDDASRSQSALVHAASGLARLPDSACLEVLTAVGDPLLTCGNDVTHVLVEGAGMSLVSAADVMSGVECRGLLSKEACIIRLLGFAMELVGLYARDPLEPRAGEVAHDLVPIATTRDLCEFLESATRLRGLERARLVTSYANDGSNSTMETLWYAAFCLPPRLGGCHLARPLQNVPLDWPDEVASVVGHGTMRPDFYWPGYETAFEHQGGDHADEAALAEDSDRARDYELCHIHYLPLTKKDARREESMRALLAQLFSIIAPYEGTAFPRKARRILNDPEVCAARRVLIGQLMPPIARLGAS